MAIKSKAADKGESSAIDVSIVNMDRMWFHIIGTSPFVPHAMSFKSAGELLMPSPRKSAAEKASTMKHEPWEEFRDAAYIFRDEDDTDTRLYLPGTMFHAAMSDVAVDLKNAKKAQVARLTSVPTMKIPLYGVPQIWCTIVREGFPGVPNVRTLPILPEWACFVPIEFVASLIKPQSIANLLSNAGVIQGIGDGRRGKGKLSMGGFRICNEDDPDYQRIVAQGKRAAQDAALAEPEYYDIETERLLRWFKEEQPRRAASPTSTRKTRTAVVPPVTVNINGGESASDQA